MVYLPTCQKRINFSFLRANVPINVLTCHTMCKCFNLTCQHAKSHRNFQIVLLRNAKGNFYTLLLHKKFYNLFNIIILHIVCTCIVNKNCVILPFSAFYQIKEKCMEFLFLMIFIFFNFSFELKT